MSNVHLYPGVNPHLNSALQSPGGDWETFHYTFMSKLGDDIDSRLPPDYYVVDGISMQSRDYEDESPGYDTLNTLLVPNAVLIQHISNANGERHTVVRIELLHPATKSSKERGARFRNKRAHYSVAGYRTLQIDLLHETPPLDDYDEVDYSQHHAGATPYNVTFVNQADAAFKFYGFGLQDALPVIQMPIQRPFLDTEMMLFSIDLNPAYRKTLESRRLFSLLTDYMREPERMHTYSEADQAFIRQTMQDIARNTSA